MRQLRGTSWGADRAAVKNIYSALIQSVIDYGYVAHGSAACTFLKILKRIQAQALKLCCWQ